MIYDLSCTAKSKSNKKRRELLVLVDRIEKWMMDHDFQGERAWSFRKERRGSHMWKGKLVRNFNDYVSKEREIKGHVYYF